jgi:hypothetical protein
VPGRDTELGPAQIEASHREQRVPRREVWVRRGLMTLLGAFCVLGLANVFGQRATVDSAGTDAAAVEVSAPQRMRSGLISTAHITVRAHRHIAAPRLVLSGDWLHQVTINTVAPAANAERGTPDGGVALAYSPLRAEESLVVNVEFQVNPTAIGRRHWDVALNDGDRPLVHVDRPGLVFP